MGASFNYEFSFDGSTENGLNITSTQSELAYMFYVNLGNKGLTDTFGLAFNQNDTSGAKRGLSVNFPLLNFM
jgi:hypothetical protein